MLGLGSPARIAARWRFSPSYNSGMVTPMTEASCDSPASVTDVSVCLDMRR